MAKQEELFQNENKFYVPMHIDNFTICLSSGYIGGFSYQEATDDFQNFNENKITGFLNFPPPSWAINLGSDGKKVVLEVVSTEGLYEKDEFVYTNQFIKITNVKKVFFLSEDDKDNFNASFRPFKEIPINLINQDVYDFKEKSEDGTDKKFTRLNNKSDFNERELIDIFLSFANKSLDILSNHDEYKKFLDLLDKLSFEEKENNLEGFLKHLISFFQNDNKKEDIDLFVITVSTILKHRRQDGFDKSKILSEIKNILIKDNKLNAELSEWFEIVEQIILSERDVPEFDDKDGSIGRRAALYFILFPKIKEIEQLLIDKKIGNIIALILKLISAAFSGFSRNKSDYKNSSEKFDLLLDFAEQLKKGKSVKIKSLHKNLDTQLLVEIENFYFNERLIFQRRDVIPTFLSTLKVCCQKSGINLSKDEKTGNIFLNCKNNIKIFCEPRSYNQKETLFFSTLIDIHDFENFENFENLKKIFELSFLEATPVGLKTVEDKIVLNTYMELLSDTLDQDEFNFVIDKMIKFNEKIKSIKF